MANVKLTQPVRHDGEQRDPGEVLTGLSERGARRLVLLGVGNIDDDVLSDDYPAGNGDALASEEDEAESAEVGQPEADQPDGAGITAFSSDIRKMNKADLTQLAHEMEIILTGKESKSELIELLSRATASPESRL